jgi:hypothetical protein
MLPNQLRRRAWSTGQDQEGTCWHCGGSGWCNCVACGTYSRGLEVVPGPCAVHAARANAGPGVMLSVMSHRATRKASPNVGGKSSKTAAAHEVPA